jgi:CheY-like chemotaxis protein
VSSFLFITTSGSLIDSIQEELPSDKYRLRHVNEIAHARQWFRLNPSLKGVFIDQHFSCEAVLAFFVECWSVNPELLCGIVSDEAIRTEYYSSLALGVEDCCGHDCSRKVAAQIKKIPEDISITRVRQHTAVLVVEDLDSPRDIICSLIESFGYSEVVGAPSVREGMSILEASPFRFFCVVTDLNMPRESGHELITNIRESMPLAYLPVIVLTSDPSEENLLKAIKTGVTGFLAKPPKRALLRGELEKAKRLVLLGRSPEIGTAEEIRLLEEVLKKRSHVSGS